MWKYFCLVALLSGCVMGLVVSGWMAKPAVEAGVVPVGNGEKWSAGVIIDSELVLTTNHGVGQGPIQAAWLSATKVVARDPEADLALLWVVGLRGPVLPIAGPNDEVIGRGTLIGYPSGVYTGSFCRIDEKGNLDQVVFAGHCGGPMILNGKIVGLVSRYHGCTTAAQIRAFLQRAGYGRLVTEK